MAVEKKVEYVLGIAGYGDLTYEGVWNSFEGSLGEFKKWHESADLTISGPPDLGGCIYCICKVDGVETPVEEVLKM